MSTRGQDPVLASEIVDRIRSVVGEPPVPLHEPYFGGNEWRYLKECLDSTFVSSVGAFVDRFEEELAAATGAARAVAVVNGTAGLQVALRLAGVGRDDEVIVPTLTFVATASAVAQSFAIPHFVDIDERTLGLDPVALRSHLERIADVGPRGCLNRETGRVIRAVVPMHTFGHPTDIDRTLAVANDFGLPVVEDAAESLGTQVGGRHTGTFGLLGVLSFNGNKTITTGGGGALLTDDVELADRAKHLTTTARVPHPWEYRHDEIGYNFRMPNLNAALGCGQLEQLPGLLAAKRRLFGKYAEAFAGLDGVRVFEEPPGCRSNYWLQTLILDSNSPGLRDMILRLTNEAGLHTRPCWNLLHGLGPYADCPRADLQVAEALAQRVINVPSSAQLGFEAER